MILPKSSSSIVFPYHHYPSVVFIKSSHFLQHCLPPPWILFCLLPIMWYRCSRLQGSITCRRT
uniref:Uncharacterized protein n=1 Tax=Arundo donax TaxID=35708 RepID=A0A0A9FNM0_ARUDO